MNKLSLNHAVSKSELLKFNILYSTDVVSVAEYVSSEKNILKAFSHSHNDYEFFISLKFVPLLVYENANYPGETGYIYPVNDNVTHGLAFDAVDGHIISIVIKQEYIENKMKEFNYSSKFYTRFMPSKDLLDLINLFINKSAENFKDLLSGNLLGETLTDLLIHDGLLSGIDNRRPEKIYGQNIRKCVLYMCKNYSNENLTIEEVARYSGYSTAHFTKTFVKYIHDTPINYLNRIRVSQAKILFKNKELTLKEIAKMVGYKNNSTFTEAFKTISGYSPKKYRDIYY